MRSLKRYNHDPKYKMFFVGFFQEFYKFNTYVLAIACTTHIHSLSDTNILTRQKSTKLE
jgi:hypothetical protein